MDTPRIPLRTAYRQLGQLVKGAAYRGQSAIITEHGRPAAMLTPVPEHIAVGNIEIDFDGWREEAVTHWIDAAAQIGYGFTVVDHEPTGSDVLALVQRDNWDHPDDATVGGAQCALVVQWPDGLAVEDRGTGNSSVTISARPA